MRELRVRAVGTDDAPRVGALSRPARTAARPIMRFVYRVEVGRDMQAANWESDATKVEWHTVATGNGDGTETISCRLKTPIDSAGDRYFIRLGVDEIP